MGSKVYPNAVKPSDAKRLRKMAASKVVQKPTAEFETGEIREVPVLPPKPNDLRKRIPLTTSALPQKRPHTFEQGSTSHPLFPAKEPLLKPVYNSIHDGQMSGYPGFHPINYGSKAPFVPDTVASQAVLKKISMYGLDKLVKELTQNLANVKFLFPLYLLWFY